MFLSNVELQFIFIRYSHRCGFYHGIQQLLLVHPFKLNRMVVHIQMSMSFTLLNRRMSYVSKKKPKSISIRFSTSLHHHNFPHFLFNFSNGFKCCERSTLRKVNNYWSLRWNKSDKFTANCLFGRSSGNQCGTIE